MERVGQSRGALISALEGRPRTLAARLAAARKVLASFARVIELDRRRDNVARSKASLTERMARHLERRGERLSRAAAKLEALSPLAILARGYAVAMREGGRGPLLSASEVRPGEKIRVRLHEGEIKAVVREAQVESRVPSPESRVSRVPRSESRAPAAPLPLFDFLFEGEGK
jgi:exodeoxyribonuclease VII large subunit